MAVRKGPLTVARRERALKLIREQQRAIGDVAALRLAGVAGTRAELRATLNEDDELREQIAEARGRAPEVIRAEIKRRAIDGVDEPVFGSLGRGEGVGEVGKKRVYSDRMLEMMARAHLPEYREQARVEHVGHVGVTVDLDFTGAIEALEQTGLLSRGRRDTAAVDAAPVALLPAQSDR